jgi:hypothetical protein
MRNELVTTVRGVPVVVMDSISLISRAEEGAIIVSGSHGGAISGAFAANHPPALVVFNDAGGGKNLAGIASLAALERQGIAAAAVSHESARIGDALDAWENGIVSHVNGIADAAGITPGGHLHAMLQRFTPNKKGVSAAKPHLG